jgi:translation initiation factor 1
MSEICSTCGLPKELCVCETIAKEQQKIQVTTDKRKFGKVYTIVSGFNQRDIDIKDLTKKLKNRFACGGTFRDDAIELQGNHKAQIRQALKDMGFAPEAIEMK